MCTLTRRHLDSPYFRLNSIHLAAAVACDTVYWPTFSGLLNTKPAPGLVFILNCKQIGNTLVYVLKVFSFWWNMLMTFTHALTDLDHWHLVTMPLLSLLCHVVTLTHDVPQYAEQFGCHPSFKWKTIHTRHIRPAHLRSSTATTSASLSSANGCSLNSRVPSDRCTLQFTDFSTELLREVITASEWCYPSRIYWLTLLHTGLSVFYVP